MNSSKRHFIGAIVVGMLLGSGTAQAADGTWDGLGSNSQWGDAGNWVSSVVPGSTSTTGNTDIATFDGTVRPSSRFGANGITSTYYLGAINVTAGSTVNRTIDNFAGAVILTLNGNTLNSVGDTILWNQSTANLTIQDGTGTLGLNLGNATANIVQVTGAGDIIINSIISGSGGGLTKTGGGILTLGGINTYSGGTDVSGGTLAMNGSGNSIVGDITVSGGTLRWDAADQVANTSNITIDSGSLEMFGSAFTDVIGSLTFNGGSITNIGQINAKGTGTALTMRGGTDLTNKFGIAGTGAQTVRFDNTVAGSATISGPVLTLVGPGSGGNTTKTFDIDDGTETVDMLISAPIGQFGAGNTLTTVNVEKTGDGTLNFASSVSYTGTTNILEGTLLLDGTHTVGGDYTVSSGATLGGSGNIGSTVNLFGTIAPGNSPGTLVTDDFNWQSGGIYEWEINATADASGTPGGDPGWDLLDLSGNTLTFVGSSFEVDIISLTLGNVSGPASGFNLPNDYTFEIARANSVVGFNAANFTLDATGFQNQKYKWSIYELGGSIYLTATAIPEPSSFVMFGLGLVGLLALRRRRTRN